MDFPACVFTPELPHVDTTSVFITLLKINSRKLKLVFWVLFISVSRCLKAVQPFFLEF